MPQNGDFLEGLNEQQLEAVTEKTGAILVLAGAGSGKTKVLTSRIANLVSQNTSPNDILAVTFTNKASKEMQERLSLYLGENIVKRMWVGTFHNICGKILRRDLESYKTKDGRKWDNNYVIYDDTDTKTIIKNALKKFNLDEKIYDIKAIKSTISNAKNKMQDAYLFASSARDYYSQKVSEIYYEYERQLALNNAIDFDDMLMLCVNLLKENEDVRKKYQQRFQHILVDEFQDTNKAQYDLINMLYPPKGEKEKTGSLMAVGDVDQSIYSWRGADFKIILNFRSDYNGAKLIKLEKNYRSSEIILNAANEVIKNNEERIEKNLYSTKGKGEKITLYEANDDFQESRFIAGKIDSIKNPKNEIAVLYRTNAQSRSIEEALMSNSIPYKIVGALKFYERKEIKDIIAYLKLIYNHNDSQALKRIINEPKRGIGDTTVNKLLSMADKEETSIFEILKTIDSNEEFNQRTKGLLINFYTLIDEMTSFKDEYSLSEYVSYVIEKSGYSASLKEDNTIENQSRLENLQEFVNVAKEFEQDDFLIDEEDDLGALGNFLSQVALVSDVDEIDENNDSVTLMTVHSAKGLEYPIVFIAGLEDGIFPHNRSIAQNNNSELEEERRLMYVALTRAKEKLYLSWAKSRKVWGNYQNYPKSRFLDEIPQSLTLEESPHKIPSMQSKSSFSAAISKIKEKSPSSITNFASSLERIKQSAEKAREKNSTPNQKNLSSSLQRLKKENKDNTSIKDMIQKAKDRALEIQNKSTSRMLGLLPIGTRVFHASFGIGKIIDITKENNTSSYVVDFTKAGKKTLDSISANLKTF